MQGYDVARSTEFIDQARRVFGTPWRAGRLVHESGSDGERHIGTDITIQGDRDATNRLGESRGVEVYESTIRPDYFKAIGIPFA